MSQALAGLLILAGFMPLWRAYRANRTTSLTHAILWAGVAWTVWGAALVFGDPDRPGLDPPRFLALCLTAGAGMAVLGARRPHIGAWDFVVLGLLAVMLLPMLESQVVGTDPNDPLRLFFLAATLSVVVLNYLPTRNGLAALLLGLGCAGELLGQFGPAWFAEGLGLRVAHLLVLLSPWAAWLGWLRRRDTSAINQCWLGFRDRLGLLWSLRAREQFNHAARHASWPVVMGWRGLVVARQGWRPAPGEEREMLDTVQAVVRRFM